MINILIPTDFSENAWNAISYGIQFFKEESANFYLLHVSIADRQENSADTAAQGLILNIGKTKGIQVKLEEIENRIQAAFPRTNHKFYALQEHSFFIEGIKRTCEERRINFIVMGTKGASGLSQAVIGTRTSEVITRIKCPVLVIPAKAKYIEPKEIAFPTDFNSYFKNKILLTLAEIIALNNSAVRVLHITKKNAVLTELQKKNKNYLEDFLGDKHHSFHFESARNIENALQDFIQKKNINVIAMVAKNLNFFQRILFEPTVAKISYHTETPFLVLHE